ncbi:MAG: 50S ribosomal protein L24, partial [Candidatus Aenigmatarchaeota archaeon]
AQYKRRSLLIRKNDKVKILRGEFKGKETKVIDVDIKKGKVYLEDVKRKNAKGIEVNIPISPSNLLLIEPVLDDPKRREKLVEVKK